MDIEFLKCRTVNSPIKSTSGSAGIDFFVPDFTYSFLQALQEDNLHLNLNLEECCKLGKIFLPPKKQILIPSGIFVKLPPHIALLAIERSGLARRGYFLGPRLIDPDYQGEIKIGIINNSEEEIVISPNMKIVQLVPLVVPEISLKESTKNTVQEFYEEVSERSAGGFGSTGV